LMTVGASYAGARAITMSSGGGFSLMVEAMGLAGITETPLVVVEAMRGGPSTGLPTKTEQSDLRFVVHASQGEFPRVVLAPGDVDESYVEIQRAFNLADMYQLPVLVLTDKYLGTSEMEFTQEDLAPIRPDRGMLISSHEEIGATQYQRFLLTDDGVSPRAFPGTAGLTFKVGSDEHNENGEISEDPSNRIEQMDKRMRKLESLLPELPKPKLYGDEQAEITLITWGSNKHACLEAAKILREHNRSVNVLHFIYVYPLDKKKIVDILDNIKVGVMVELNKTGQFAGMLAEYVGYQVDYKFLKYTGEPVYSEEIVEFINREVK
jgi:2-oxoglutarate ferredoxin oxidoreductase subunit alpha